jgi:hypothetical protein
MLMADLEKPAVAASFAVNTLASDGRVLAHLILQLHSSFTVVLGKCSASPKTVASENFWVHIDVSFPIEAAHSIFGVIFVVGGPHISWDRKSLNNFGRLKTPAFFRSTKTEVVIVVIAT